MNQLYARISGTGLLADANVVFAVVLMLVAPAVSFGKPRKDLPANPIASNYTHDKTVYFLLAGNSNMQGRAVITATDTSAHPRVIAADLFAPAAGWQNARDPLFSQNSRGGMGPGLTFAKLYADKHPDHLVGLLCVAQAGSQVNQWIQGRASWNRIWDSAFIERATDSERGKIGGVLAIFGLEYGWGSQQAYTDTLKRFVNNWREHLAMPGLPFIFLEPTPFTDAASPVADPKMIAAIREICSKDNLCSRIPGDDLRSCDEDGEGCIYNPDRHYSHQSNLIIAGRFFEALTAIEERSSTKPPFSDFIHATGSMPLRSAAFDLLGRTFAQYRRSVLPARIPGLMLIR